MSAARVIPHLIPKAVAGSVNFYGSVPADLVQYCPGLVISNMVYGSVPADLVQ